MPLKFQWEKHRPEPAVRALLESAVVGFNQTYEVKTHIIRHPFGKIIVCRKNDLIFFHANHGGRPPRLSTLAVVVGPEPRFLFPEQDAADFATCCDLIRVADEADRTAFRRFLFPQASRPLATPLPGAP